MKKNRKGSLYYDLERIKYMDFWKHMCNFHIHQLLVAFNSLFPSIRWSLPTLLVKTQPNTIILFYCIFFQRLPTYFLQPRWCAESDFFELQIK
jgi:hypothetical protein